MKSLLHYFVVIFVFAFISEGSANNRFDYQLKPQKVAKDTYVFVGSKEDFSFENGGNIVNTGFIVTDEGVVVIDTGPSLRYGEQMKKAIGQVTDKQVVRIYLTHHHPDHFLGNQAFDGVDIVALEQTKQNMALEGSGFTDNLYMMVGDWMRGTDMVMPNKTVEPGMKDIGGHQLEIMSFIGHTSGDMALFDHTTGVLFAGDLLFHKRTLTTPHASIDEWLEAVDQLSHLKAKIVVPGHGPISENEAVFTEMKDYLTWLDETLMHAASKGLSMMDAMKLPLPDKFKDNALLKEEYSRSIIHLYPKYEKLMFKQVN